MTYIIDDPRKWRISKSGFSIKTGWADEKKVVAKYPGITSPLNNEQFKEWLDNAEKMCDLHNASLGVAPQVVSDELLKIADQCIKFFGHEANCTWNYGALQMAQFIKSLVVSPAQPQPDCKKVYIVAADAVSDSGRQLYELHDNPVPMADQFVLYEGQPAPSAVPLGWVPKKDINIMEAAYKFGDHDQGIDSLLHICKTKSAAESRYLAPNSKDEIVPIYTSAPSAVPVDLLDAARYRRLRTLGCTVYGTKNLAEGTVSCFQNLDEIVDRDLQLNPSRGEASPAQE